MSTNPKLTIVLVVAFILVNGGLLLYFKGSDIQTFLWPSRVDLPVPLSHRSIQSALMTYNFRGTVRDTQAAGNATRIRLDAADSKLPDFLVTSDTKIYKFENNNQILTQLSEIKPQTNVVLGMTYDLNKKEWSLRAVFISAPSTR